MKQKKWLIMVGAFFCCLLIAGVSRAAGNTKAGYIDINRLVNESDMGKAASADLKKFRSEKQAELKKKEGQINKLAAVLTDPQNHMDESTRLTRTRELADLKKEYKRMTDDANEAISWKNDDIVRHILEKAIPIIKHEAEKEGYTMIFKNPDDMIYVGKSVDITDSVIQQLNQEFKKRKK